MSLDVYLERPSRREPCVCVTCGSEHVDLRADEVFTANLSSKCVQLAKSVRYGNFRHSAACKCGCSEFSLYDFLWEPETLKTAWQRNELARPTAQLLLSPLAFAIGRLDERKDEESMSDYFVRTDFILWLEKYLEACKQYPDAVVRASS